MIVMLAFGSVSIFMLGLIVEFLHMSMLQLPGKPTFFVVNRASDNSFVALQHAGYLPWFDG